MEAIMETDNEKNSGNHGPDNQNLERLGYTQEVKRNFSLTAMVATCVNLMSTWEALSSTLAAGLVSGGPVSLVYGAVVAFLGSLCAAMSLAELASSYPTAGGQYHSVAILSPKANRPLTSWLAGYISTLGWIAVAGSAPFLAGTQIQGLLVLNYPDTYVFERWHGTMLFWAILIVSACVCIFCSNFLPLIEKLTLVLHIGFFIIIMVVIATLSPTTHTAKFVFTNFENNSGWGSDAIAWSIGLLSSCYVLIGYDGATHLSEEMNKAEIGVPRAMVGSILINGPLGFGFLIAVLFFMGDIASALDTPTGFPIIQIFYNITGSLAAATALTSAITVMASLSTVPLITSAARVMWAFARDGGLPFSRHLAKVDSRRQIPSMSISIVTFLLILLGLINIGSTTAFNAILSLAVVSLQISYLLPIVLLIWRRVCRPDTLSWGPWRLGRAGIFFNILAVIYLTYTCIFLLFPPFQPITAANMNYAPVVLGAALIFGCVYWPLRVSKRYIGPLSHQFFLLPPRLLSPGPANSMEQTPAPSGPSRRSQKSRSGCITCKKRRLKCDEAEPACRRCTKSGRSCPGYIRPVKWSTKYERNSDPLLNSSVSSKNLPACSGLKSSKQPQATQYTFSSEQADASPPEINLDDTFCSTRPRPTYIPSLLPQCGQHRAVEQDDFAIDSLDATSLPDSLHRLTPSSKFSLSRDAVHAVDASNLDEKTSTAFTSTEFGDSLTLYAPQADWSMLLSHYFSSVCQVASSFDSAYNPYRSEMSDMMRHSPIIFNCVMSMSAAHLCQQEKSASATPLLFQTEAISKIAQEVAKVELNPQVFMPPKHSNTSQDMTLFNSTVKDDLLLGIIILGMTSSWHHPSSLGLYHLTGARQLFKIWMAKNNLFEVSHPLSRLQSFLVSSMVYWEVMVSCLIDQEMDAVSYLDVFCDLPTAIFSHPCPWTGVGTSILIRLAKSINLVRQRVRIRNLADRDADGANVAKSSSLLIKEAIRLEEEVVKSQIPFIGIIKDTGDPHTPADHLHKIARCHRLATLLELHRAFPELASGQNTTGLSKHIEHDGIDESSQKILGLAFEILEIMQTIPDDSGTIAIQSLVYLIAGSALGFGCTMEGPGTSSQIRLRGLIKSWRQFVLERLYLSYLSLKLQTINRVATVLKEVWSRMDSLTVTEPNTESCWKGSFTQTHWIDVMVEKKLETILG
ncbi:amino acid permease-domain-containing protein [Mariannaea sp. PMI_226]|nr:amino acid permease-domain-containing protein [Mariannaea sp. PMI_226]